MFIEYEFVWGYVAFCQGAGLDVCDSDAMVLGWRAALLTVIMDGGL